MSWILGGVTLPNPSGHARRPVEISKSNITLDGSTRKDIIRQKWQYILSFRMLTQSQVSSIMSLYNDKEAKSFAVNDGDLTIAAVDVWMDIDERQYNTKGSEFREDFRLILTEV